MGLEVVAGSVVSFYLTDENRDPTRRPIHGFYLTRRRASRPRTTKPLPAPASRPTALPRDRALHPRTTKPLPAPASRPTAPLRDRALHPRTTKPLPTPASRPTAPLRDRALHPRTTKPLLAPASRPTASIRSGFANSCSAPPCDALDSRTSDDGAVYPEVTFRMESGHFHRIAQV